MRSGRGSHLKETGQTGTEGRLNAEEERARKCNSGSVRSMTSYMGGKRGERTYLRPRGGRLLRGGRLRQHGPSCSSPEWKPHRTEQRLAAGVGLGRRATKAYGRGPVSLRGRSRRKARVRPWRGRGDMVGGRWASVVIRVAGRRRCRDRMGVRVVRMVRVRMHRSRVRRAAIGERHW